MSEPRTLYLDVETSPHLADVWGLFNQNIGLPQLRIPSGMICVTGKFRGEKPQFFSNHHAAHDDMLEAIHEMMNDADVIVTYNGKAFDIPVLYREFLVGSLDPPSPSKQLDLYQIVKKNFRFASNKLAFVSKALGLEGKVQHSGHELWTKCMDGDDKAWKLMRKYNIQDVVLLEEMHDKLRPWIWNGPNAGLYASGDCCPNCGSRDLRREGFAYLTAGRYQRHQCRNCSGWSRSSRRDSGVLHQGINPK